MTRSQIDYQKHLETVRSNKKGEDLREQELVETKRSNLARESETHRSNVVKENENYRHNVRSENLSEESNIIDAIKLTNVVTNPVGAALASQYLTEKNLGGMQYKQDAQKTIDQAWQSLVVEPATNVGNYLENQWDTFVSTSKPHLDNAAESLSNWWDKVSDAWNTGTKAVSNWISNLF